MSLVMKVIIFSRFSVQDGEFFLGKVNFSIFWICMTKMMNFSGFSDEEDEFLWI
jgi:hypothetical protein